jgi:predicted nucleic acid-binding Zn ribbon protein
MLIQHCQKEIEENSNFCSNCGYKIKNVKICPNCGYENNLIDRFCKKCGYSFEKTKNFKLNKFFIIFPILLFLLVIFIFLFKPKNKCVYQILENKSFKIDSFYLKSNKIQIQYHSFGPYSLDQNDTLEISIKTFEGKALLFILSSQETGKFKKQYDFRNYKLITSSSTIRYSPTEKNNYFVFKKSNETKEFEISCKALKYNLILKLIKCP